MTHHSSQIPWTDEQWSRIENVVQREARSARVAASFLPLYGPLPPDADFVRRDTIHESSSPMTIADRETVQLATLQVRVELRGPQVADPELSSALQLFRRAANVLARLEDLVVFRGLDVVVAPPDPPTRAPTGYAGGLPGGWEITSGEPTPGLWSAASPRYAKATGAVSSGALGKSLVGKVAEAIGKLEDFGHFGPFAVVLGRNLFTAVETPDPTSLVLPQDRIVPFLGGGSLHRSSALTENAGVVVALGGAPVDLVVAKDMSVNFMTVTTEPSYVFRVVEKIVLRIKQEAAIWTLRT